MPRVTPSHARDTAGLRECPSSPRHPPSVIGSMIFHLEVSAVSLIVTIKGSSRVLTYVLQGVDAAFSVRAISAKEEESHAEVQIACLTSAIASVGFKTATQISYYRIQKITV